MLAKQKKKPRSVIEDNSPKKERKRVSELVARFFLFPHPTMAKLMLASPQLTTFDRLEPFHYFVVYSASRNALRKWRHCWFDVWIDTPTFNHAGRRHDFKLIITKFVRESKTKENRYYRSLSGSDHPSHSARLFLPVQSLAHRFYSHGWKRN